MQTFTASVEFAAFLNGLRSTGTNLQGTNTQIACLLRDALDALRPSVDAAAEDADALISDLEVIAESLGGEADYADPDDEEDEEEVAPTPTLSALLKAFA